MGIIFLIFNSSYLYYKISSFIIKIAAQLQSILLFAFNTNSLLREKNSKIKRLNIALNGCVC